MTTKQPNLRTPGVQYSIQFGSDDLIIQPSPAMPGYYYITINSIGVASDYSLLAHATCNSNSTRGYSYITLGQPQQGSLIPGQVAYFKFSIPSLTMPKIQISVS